MFEAIIRQIFKNHRSHLLLSTLDLVLLKELTSSTSYHTRITARQVMNFSWQNLDSEFLITDSRLSQPNKELLVTFSHGYACLVASWKTTRKTLHISTQINDEFAVFVLVSTQSTISLTLINTSRNVTPISRHLHYLIDNY